MTEPIFYTPPWDHPDQFDVGFKVYDIVSSDSNCFSSLRGLTDSDNNIIIIHWDLPLEEYKLALLHEMFHVICDAVGCDDDSLSKLKKVDEEFIVENLSRGIFIMKRNNRALFEFIFSSEDEVNICKKRQEVYKNNFNLTEKYGTYNREGL